MIRIITVGKLKEDYLKDAKDEYLKRLGKYTKIEIIEVEDSKIDQENIAFEEEKDKILKNILPKSYIITLEIDGKELSSIELSNLIDKIQIEYSDITFIIGGSYGIHKDIKEKANYHLSFSKLTFPHQLFRILLLEQIYRSYKILNNEKYHK